MDRVRHLVFVVALVSCKGDDEDSGNTDSGAGDDGPVSFVFKTAVTAVEYQADVVDDALSAHQVSSMLLASASTVVADQKVQDRLNTDGGGDGGPDFRSGVLDCWTRPDFPMFSFTIDYTPCTDSYFMTGGVFVNDHPSGPLLFEYNNFQITGPGNIRELGGVLAFDTRDAFPESLYWQVYNTDSLNPGLENPVPITVKVDRVQYGVNYSGGASVDFLAQQWSMWGVATIGPVDAPLTVVHGGRVPEDVAPAEPSGADVMKTPLNWLECRCPTSGVTALDMPLHFVGVTVDLDDLEEEPDETDDPRMDIPVDFELAGQGVLTSTGCGTYDVEYQTQTVEIPLSKEQLVGAVSFQCATAAVPDERRCAAMVAAANNIEQDLKIEIPTSAATATALAAVEADFDTAWCKIY